MLEKGGGQGPERTIVDSGCRRVLNLRAASEAAGRRRQGQKRRSGVGGKWGQGGTLTRRETVATSYHRDGD